MELKKRVIGIDAGSVTVSVVVMDLNGEVLNHRYEYHHGKPAMVLRDILLEIDYSNIIGVARTDSAPDIYKGSVCFDPNISIIKGVKFFYTDFRSILNVGGEKFALIEFDKDGNYLNMKSNTSCAAGT
ncbi:MAG: hypothetical protein KAH95_09895, partial [Spirochaetales bacterium]|nr:hypothetical protein [Spirochaetales bacterium]